MADTTGRADEKELALINKYTRRALTQDDVYTFSVVLCDNELDRDCERFSDEALDKMAELFEGVTGITDHDPKSANQKARIYSLKVQRVDGRLCFDKKPYKRLLAKAYIPRTGENDGFIKELDTGIKKEVSVGCAVKRHICSVCKEDIGSCGHIRGRKYAGALCYATLDEVTDAYEWSFVAVPSQRAAGGIKSYTVGDRERGTVKEIWTSRDIDGLEKRVEELSELAGDGEYYREKLKKELFMWSRAVLPELSEEFLLGFTEKMSAKELFEFRNALGERMSELYPVKPQLWSGKEKNEEQNDIYKNI